MVAIHRFKAHPWHGISLGDNVPHEVATFIEIVPTDTVKYEVDKNSGYLSIDRPQKYSNPTPALYGFLPRTYSSKLVAELTNQALERTDILGDGDPLDVLVLTEKSIPHGDIIVKSRPIGGLRMVDQNFADDKIIAVMGSDAIYGKFCDISELPQSVLDRIIHYFTTYKDLPSDKTERMKYVGTYGAAVARDLVMRAVADYDRDIRDKVK
jgi:inorganic pyrophosphatase